MKDNSVVDLCLSMHPLWLSLVENPPEDVRYRVFRLGFFSKAYFRLANYLPFL